MRIFRGSTFIFPAVVLGAAIVLAAVLPVAAAVYTVPGDFATLDEARRVAGAGDTVVIPGDMKEPSPPGPQAFRLLRAGGARAGVETLPPPPDRILCTESTVSGRVTDKNGAGISNAVALFENEATGEEPYAFTSPTGDYTVCLPAGNYGLSFSRADLLESIYNGKKYGCGDTVVVGQNATVTGIDGVMGPGGSITGTVTTDGSTPLPDVYVLASGLDVPVGGSATTDATGAYTITGLPTGHYTVYFKGNGAADPHGISYYDGHLREANSDPVSVTEGSATSAIDAVMPLGGSISGTVGVGGVQVWAVLPDGTKYRFDYSSISGGGAYQITGLPTGSYKVFFQGHRVGYLDKWYPGSVAVTVPSDTGGINGTLLPAGSLSGNVTSGASPLANVDVTVVDSHGNVVTWSSTDAAGAYTVPGLPSGEYRVHFWGEHLGYINEWYDGQKSLGGAGKVAVTAPNDTANVEAQLDAATTGTLGGRVNFRGEACDIVRVRVFPPDALDEEWYVYGQRIGPSGYWRSGPLPSGRYLVQADTDRTDLMSRWYGGTPSPAFAKAARVTAGQDTNGINFKLQTRNSLPEAKAALGEFENITFMGPGEKEPLLLSLDCNGAAGLPVDYWILAFTPLSPPHHVYHFEPGSGWVPGLAVSHQGPCMKLNGFRAARMPFVPVNGRIDFVFGVDGVMNGLLDPGLLFYDGVRAQMYR